MTYHNSRASGQDAGKHREDYHGKHRLDDKPDTVEAYQERRKLLNLPVPSIEKNYPNGPQKS